MCPSRGPAAILCGHRPNGRANETIKSSDNGADGGAGRNLSRFGKRHDLNGVY